jgi:hypothetical protein
MYWYVPPPLPPSPPARRQDDDGSYLVVYQSTSHPLCPPMRDHVRAKVENLALHIAPARGQCVAYLNVDTIHWYCTGAYDAHIKCRGA